MVFSPPWKCLKTFALGQCLRLLVPGHFVWLRTSAVLQNCIKESSHLPLLTDYKYMGTSHRLYPKIFLWSVTHPFHVDSTFFLSFPLPFPFHCCLFSPVTNYRGIIIWFIFTFKLFFINSFYDNRGSISVFNTMWGFFRPATSLGTKLFINIIFLKTLFPKRYWNYHLL